MRKMGVSVKREAVRKEVGGHHGFCRSNWSESAGRVF